MTISNNVQLDMYKRISNDTKKAISNNTKIEENLHVIMVISNPCSFVKRYTLAKEFIFRMESEENVILYIVELCYSGQQHRLTKKNNPKHLQLYTDTSPLWHKENMINIGVTTLLPINWKAFAWIDADIEFENTYWASDALKCLNGYKDIIQLFSHCIDMDNNTNTLNIFPSFGYQYCKQKDYKTSANSGIWHPGYAWAITRQAYDKIGGLYENSILGSGDNNMALSILGYGFNSLNPNVSEGYKNQIENYQKKICTLRLGYIPGVIKHYFHGTKANRKYKERWKILVDNNYDPNIHIVRNSKKLLVPTKECPIKMLDDILVYFKERNEDET